MRFRFEAGSISLGVKMVGGFRFVTPMEIRPACASMGHTPPRHTATHGRLNRMLMRPA